MQAPVSLEEYKKVRKAYRKQKYTAERVSVHGAMSKGRVWVFADRSIV
jgi:hypothetical protein